MIKIEEIINKMVLNIINYNSKHVPNDTKK